MPGRRQASSTTPLLACMSLLCIVRYETEANAVDIEVWAMVGLPWIMGTSIRQCKLARIWLLGRW